MTANIRIAAAPISWGVCEVPGWGRVLDAPTVLGEMAELGITATELGPPGFLPRDPAELKKLLGGHGLTSSAVSSPWCCTKTPKPRWPKPRTPPRSSPRAGPRCSCSPPTGLDGYDERPALTDAEWTTLINPIGSANSRPAMASRPCCTPTSAPTPRREPRSNGSSPTPTWRCASTPVTC